MTATTKPLPPHGTKTCRSDDNRHAEYVRNKARQVAILAGHRFTMEAAIVATHIDKLIKAGATANGISVAARTGAHTVQDIHAGARVTTHATVAERILAVTLDAALNPYEVRVDSIGSVRQIRALMAAGHSIASIRAAGEPEVERTTASELINGKLPRIRACTAAAINTAYARLSMKTGTSAKSRLRAERAGWAPPAAWDGIDMADPDAFPDFTGHCGTLKGHRIHEDRGIPVCSPCNQARVETRPETLGCAA